MARGIRRAFIVAALALVVGLLAQGVYAIFLCSRHQAWVRARTGKPVILLPHQYGVPRLGDVIFACEAPHRIGPLTLHADLVCYCGPPASREEMSALVGGPCVVDSPTEHGGQPACSPGYCDEHLGF